MTAVRTVAPVAAMKGAVQGRTRRRAPRERVAHVAGWAIVVIWAFPIYWLVNTSLKTTDNIISTTPQFLPLPLTLDNYVRALEKPGFLQSLGNSMLITLATVAVALLVSFLACAALTRFMMPGRRGALITLLAVQMVPATAILIPLFLAFKNVGLVNTYWGVVLAYLATVVPFAIWALRGFFYAVPTEIDESARIDGAGNMRVLFSIYLPLVLPGLISTSVFSFITAWNDYIVAYVLMQERSKYTLPVWLVSFATDRSIDYGGLIAGSVIFSLPAVIFFFLVQRNLVSNAASGSVKG
jgi:N,N'-diacetylchitobiose transport system permease protein